MSSRAARLLPYLQSGVAETPWYLAGGAPAPLGAWVGKGAASKVASLVNLANPGTYDLAEIGTVGWNTLTGWAGASSAALNTGINPANLNYTFILAYDDGGTGSTGIPMGVSTSGQMWIRPNDGSSNRYYGYHGAGGAGNTVSGVSTSGVMAIAGANCYLNGVPDGTITQGSFLALANVYITCRNNSAPATNYAGNVIAAAIWNSVLTAGQVAAVSAEMVGF